IQPKLAVTATDMTVSDNQRQRSSPAPRLAIARQAATLFLTRGVAGTSGKDIAAASGVSERTVWRHFRTKESCVEPLLSRSALRFTEHMRRWSRRISIEDHLHERFAL